MAERLLDGVLVLDLAGEPAAMTGRLLADLGAEVVTVEPTAGSPVGRVSPVWRFGKRVAPPGELDALLGRADVVIDTPYWPGAFALDPARAPRAVWVSVTPFGLDGPRARWRASDLGVMAATANMYSTGDPDRAPVRPSQPASYAHTGPEAAFAALSALWSGIPQRVDVSMQEVVFVANMTGTARFVPTGFRGRRLGANIGRSREIWATSDGWVSFGLRGGKARVPSLELLTKLVATDGIDASALEAMDWPAFNQNTVTDDELRAITGPLAEYFSRHSTAELYEIACESNLMLAPINSPREIYAGAQLAARDFFAELDGVSLPRSCCTVHTRDVSRGSAPTVPSLPAGAGAWAGVNVLEFGSGAAGPISTRYFAEHGAAVLRVESRSRPDFLRVYALGPDNPHGLEGAPMYDGLNVGKRNVTLNLKHPDAVALVRRLVAEWADAVVENFAPRAMKGFGLDYESLAAVKPDLVMASACLNGQTGPYKDYPGFGSQGAALSGFTFITGWPDREPIGPHGTITDSLAPRFVATALAAALWHRRRTGNGVYLDLSQVEAGIYSLSPWLARYRVDGVIEGRIGNRSLHAAPHGAFPCADEDGVPDRWVAIACWTDDEWAALAGLIGVDDPSLATAQARLARVDDVEALVSAWTGSRTRLDVAEQLQAAGIEAVPVQDYGDVHADPQVAHRQHFVPLHHPYLGDGLYERNGFRLPACPGGYERAGPTLGQDNDWVLGKLLGLTAEEQARLREVGAVE
ncbi:MAG: CoA transferase [Acidimicrobiia bacterium]